MNHLKQHLPVSLVVVVVCCNLSLLLGRVGAVSKIVVIAFVGRTQPDNFVVGGVAADVAASVCSR